MSIYSSIHWLFQSVTEAVTNQEMKYVWFSFFASISYTGWKNWNLRIPLTGVAPLQVHSSVLKSWEITVDVFGPKNTPSCIYFGMKTKGLLTVIFLTFWHIKSTINKCLDITWSLIKI